jgi:cytochrome P450
VEECGDIFKINFIGKEFIVSAKPELNTEILKLRPEKFRRFSKINEILTEMGIVGVFNAEGETWKKQRKPSSEALNLKKVKGYYPTIQNTTEKLIHNLTSYSNNNTVVDIQKELSRYAIDITTAIAFGHELNTLSNKGNDFQKHLELIFPMINERITAPIPLWRFYKQKKDKALTNSLKAIEKIIYNFIQEAKKRLLTYPELKDSPSNFLEALLVEQEEENKFSEQEIYGNVFSILLAGEDTTSNSISWALYYLSQHPEIVLKVRQEAITVYNNRNTPKDTKELNKLKYANAVAQEAIRLKPVSPNLYMQANENITLHNLYIPKDTSIMLQNKVSQTSNKYFSNPNDFMPERWIKSDCPMQEKHSPEIIKAFGGGPRFCPGMNLAMYEMTIAISSICKLFNFNLAVKPNEVKEQFAFTMFPENLLLQFHVANTKE